jgi:predicted SnoaL-like aldol condensation-catalyzing enzyme
MTIHSTETVSVNTDVALTFLEMVSTGRAREAFDRYAASDFRHHNPYFNGDGESLAMAMDHNYRDNPQKQLEVIHAIGGGPYVAIHSRVRHSLGFGSEHATVHLFRLEDGKVMELWDIAQEVPTQTPNQYGMF